MHHIRSVKVFASNNAHFMAIIQIKLCQLASSVNNRRILFEKVLLRHAWGSIFGLELGCSRLYNSLSYRNTVPALITHSFVMEWIEM